MPSFATALDGAVTATQPKIVVDAAAAVDGNFFVQVDEEFMLVERGGNQTRRYPNTNAARVEWQVRRAQLGSLPAVHNDNAVVTQVVPSVATADPVAPPPGVAQAVSLLGPFPFAFDSSGIAGTGGAAQAFRLGGFFAVGGVIPEGAVVLAVWPAFTTDFDENSLIAVYVQPVDDPDRASQLALWLGTDEGISGEYQASLASAPAAIFVVQSLNPCELMVALGSSDNPPNQGQADIYALIATPA